MHFSGEAVSEKEILLLGDDRLYQISEPLSTAELKQAARIIRDLKDTLNAFRGKYGFGRAIAAPQIGEFKRIIYMETKDLTIGFINPVLSFPSDERFEVWDDCMSFPGLEVRVLRYKNAKILYRDLDWNECEISFTDDLSELIQHEYDHLDGILAVQNALDLKSFRINKKKAVVL